MRVSRLHLQGFKSFSGRVELELGPGITAIVGPNGSGKSNLVDAIRLVLGETSARELRGQRLDQVIFAGGAKRPPVGMAEVGIVFENEDGWLPVEDLEVSIARRVFRDGTSEFRRNGHRVRLRDLGRLLDATGLAQAGYAVIAQNDIEAIIRATPGQRRHLIEEAAGVRGAQALVEDAGARLRSLSEWLEGSTGRLAELLPRIEALREEAAVADEAAALRARVKELRGSLERGAWLTALAEQRRLERMLQGAERRCEQLRQRSQEFHQGYLADRERLQAIESGRIESERLAGSLALAVQHAQDEADRWQDRLVQAAESQAAAEQTLAEARDDLQSMIGDGAGAVEDQGASGAGRARVAGLEGELAGLRGERSGLQTELASSQARSQELELAAAAARRRRSELEAELAGAESFRSQAQAAQSTAEQVRLTTLEELAAAADEARRLRGLAAREAAALERSQKAESGQRELVQRAEDQLSKATVALREAEARHAARVGAVEGRAESLPIAGAAAQGRARLRRLAEGVSAAQAEDSAAVEAGLGAFLQALVGEEAAAREALSLAGEVAELVCWPLPHEPVVENPPEGCRPLATALEGEASALAVVTRVTRLVCLARDRQAAARWLARLPDGRAVLPDGTVVGTGLEITPARSDGELRALERLRGARRTVELERAELARAEERLARARETHSEQRVVVDHQREQAATALSAAASAELEEARLQAAAERARAALAGLQGELQGRAERSARDATALAAVVAELEAVEAEAGVAGAELEGFRGAAVELDRRILAAARGLEEARLQIAGLEAAARARSRRAEELARRREQLLAREQAAALRIRAAEAIALEARGKLAGARDQAARARDQMAQAAEVRSQAAKTTADPLRGLAELERRRAELDASVRSAAGAVEGIRRETAGQAQRVNQLRSELDESLAADLGGEELQEVHEPGRSAQEIARLERRLSAIGLINELAPRQLTQLLERTEGLRSAHDDCLRAKSELDRVLGCLEEVSGTRFDKTLKQVDKEFESVWVELFGGGRAALVASPGEGGAPPGGEMEVQPPGKRPIPMPLLSGGERALTALALVLALQQVSPSPFYVFDEVDAALDEANIAQFAKLLQRRAETSQFVVVTHNLTTMSTASILYGVTQDGDGSSRLLSVRLTADGQSVEAEDGVGLESVAAGG